jgi:hypothetical protein
MPQPLCFSCCYFVSQPGPLGTCQRLAPTHRGFPLVSAVDFCGEHRAQGQLLRPPPPLDPEGDGLPRVPPHNPATCRFCQSGETRVPFHGEE